MKKKKEYKGLDTVDIDEDIKKIIDENHRVGYEEYLREKANQDKKEKKSKIIGNIITVVAIIILIILFILLIKVNNNITNDAIDSCMKLGHEYNWCRARI